jgi:DNA-binding LacI/PurR family transcriptional regulator
MTNTTIKDVAKKAGVSTATVSRVINRVGYFTPDIEKKVNQAIQELGYRPNAVARSLKCEYTKIIGLIVTDMVNPFLMWTAKTLESTVSNYDYNVIVCSTEEDPQKELKYLKMLIDRRVDGLVLSATGKNNDYIREIVNKKIPVILIDRKYNDLDELDVILDDNFTGGYLLTKHLIDKGHRKIALIKGHPTSITSEERSRGFLKALTDHGIEVISSYIRIGGRSGEFTRQVVKEFFEMADPPTAVFAVNNLIAKNMIMVMHELNKSFPEDIALVCYGLEEFKTLFKPSLTCVIQKPALMGMRAGEMIIDRIKTGYNSKRVELVFAPEIFIGDSL